MSRGPPKIFWKPLKCFSNHTEHPNTLATPRTPQKHYEHHFKLPCNPPRTPRRPQKYTETTQNTLATTQNTPTTPRGPQKYSENHLKHPSNNQNTLATPWPHYSDFCMHRRHFLLQHCNIQFHLLWVNAASMSRMLIMSFGWQEL